MAEIDNEVKEALAQYKPLEDKILGMVANIPVWNYKTIAELFPNDHSKSIYRAIAKLEKSGRIRCLGWHGRTKQYSTYDVSNLPILVTKTGQQVPLNAFVQADIPSMYTDKQWNNLVKLNRFPVLVAEMFIAAQRDDETVLENYQAIIKQLVEMKTATNILATWIETLLQHTIFSGDEKIFKALLKKEMPDPEILNSFKVWYYQTFKDE